MQSRCGSDDESAGRKSIRKNKLGGLRLSVAAPDGYHEILSVAQCVDLADVLDFELASSDQLTCSLDSLSTGTRQLGVPRS